MSRQKSNNNHYRIKFFIVKGFLKQNHVDTTADNASHFQVCKNNAFLAEFRNLKNAIEKIIEEEGENQELNNLMENIFFIEKPTAMFNTTGITYTQKHGVLIEQKFRA